MGAALGLSVGQLAGRRRGVSAWRDGPARGCDHGGGLVQAAWGGGCWAVFPVDPEPQPPPSNGGTSLEGP